MPIRLRDEYDASLALADGLSSVPCQVLCVPAAIWRRRRWRRAFANRLGSKTRCTNSARVQIAQASVCLRHRLRVLPARHYASWRWLVRAQHSEWAAFSLLFFFSFFASLFITVCSTVAELDTISSKRRNIAKALTWAFCCVGRIYIQKQKKLR